MKKLRALQEGGKTALYRLYDRDGTLLYVGITHDLQERWRSHARNQIWWLDVARKEHVWFNTRAEAETAEKRAILSEDPLRDKSRRPRTGQGTDAFWPETDYDNPRRDPYEEAMVAAAAEKIMEALRDGRIPTWSVLPVVHRLGRMVGVSTRAANLARRRMTTGPLPLLAQVRDDFVALGAGDFDQERAEQYGLFYLIAAHHFGSRPFTARELAGRACVAAPTVMRHLSWMAARGLVQQRLEPTASFMLRVEGATTEPEASNHIA